MKKPDEEKREVFSLRDHVRAALAHRILCRPSLWELLEVEKAVKARQVTSDQLQTICAEEVNKFLAGGGML